MLLYLTFICEFRGYSSGLIIKLKSFQPHSLITTDFLQRRLVEIELKQLISVLTTFCRKSSVPEWNSWKEMSPTTGSTKKRSNRTTRRIRLNGHKWDPSVFFLCKTTASHSKTQNIGETRDAQTTTWSTAKRHTISGTYAATSSCVCNYRSRPFACSAGKRIIFIYLRVTTAWGAREGGRARKSEREAAPVSSRAKSPSTGSRWSLAWAWTANPWQCQTTTFACPLYPCQTQTKCMYLSGYIHISIQYLCILSAFFLHRTKTFFADWCPLMSANKKFFVKRTNVCALHFCVCVHNYLLMICKWTQPTERLPQRHKWEDEEKRQFCELMFLSCRRVKSVNNSIWRACLSPSFAKLWYQMHRAIIHHPSQTTFIH